ncbi:MAG: NgoBV family restriction endonuclease [Synergistaceae bacterium]|nr:NgoBV family restriction endonuclease [Synergistaceae bacterium]
MANLITARELFRLLVFDYGIKSLIGHMKFQLGDISVAVRRRDVVGEVIQYWLERWLTKSRFDFAPNPIPQMPPDIYLNTEDFHKDWLEVKAFNCANSPRFSIADFNFFVRDLIERPWHLDADYLIFGYEMSEAGDLKISGVWLKKIWEITKVMTKWPLTVQVRGGVINEIRPCSWYAHRTSTKVFESLEDFLSAFEQAIYKNPATSHYAPRWRSRFTRAYQKYYGKEILIPDWESIRPKYITRGAV